MRVIFLFVILTVSAFADVTIGNCSKSYKDWDIPIGVGFSPFNFVFHLDVDQVTVKTKGHEIVYDLSDGYAVVTVDGFAGNAQDPSTALDEIKRDCPKNFLAPGDFGSIRLGPRSVALPNTAAGQANQDVAAGDFNGDGVMDTAVLTASGVLVKLFAADGTTLTTVNYPVAGIGSSLAVGDFNGDGVPDLVATQNDSSGNVGVLLGKGDGTFGSAAKFPVGDFAFYLTTGDFNADGVADLAVTNFPNRGTGTVVVLLGRGDGTFMPGGSYPVGPAPDTIVAADFNGDGVLDLAELDANSSAANKVWVLAGRGDGTFAPAVSTLTGTGSAYLQYGDLNHDGKMDLVIADMSASAMTVMMGNGDGTFQPAQEYVIGPQPISIAVLPLGDGNTSLFTQDNLSGDFYYTFARTDGSIVSPKLQTVGLRPAAVGAVDLNGDSHPDLVITDSESRNVYVEMGNAVGPFSKPVAYPAVRPPGPLTFADVNGDGYRDVIVADSGGIEVMPGNGDGTLGTAQVFSASGALSSISVADFNGDGRPDVAAANGSSGAVSLFMGNGDATFQGERMVFLGGGLTPLSAVSGDFNGDGAADLIVAYRSADFTQGGLAVLLGNGDGSFQSPVKIALPFALVTQGVGTATTAALTVADFNGDGKTDVVTAVYGLGSNQVAVLLGNGDGTFQAPLMTSTNTAPPVIIVADLNADGLPDLVLGDCCGLSEASYLYGNGDGTFQAEVRFPSGPNPSGIAAADFNGDGLPDLAIIGRVIQPDRGTLAVLINPGLPTTGGSGSVRTEHRHLSSAANGPATYNRK
jgi:hypothetical protein